MSQAVAAAEVRAEIGVVARSQYASVVHRPDPDSDEPRPACHEAEVDHAEDYREVAVDAVTPHYEACQNPACFGPSDRGGAHIWAGPLADRPVRIQAFQFAVIAAVRDRTPFVRRDVHDVLAVGDSRGNSIKRGLRDARAAGWLVWDSSGQEYRQGPLAAEISGGKSA